MGNYAVYVWSAYLVTLLALGGEVLLLIRRRRRAAADRHQHRAGEP